MRQRRVRSLALSRQRAEAKAAIAREWLRAFLTAGPRKVHETRTAADLEGINSATLYRARDQVGALEYTQEGRKWWRLPSEDDPEEPGSATSIPNDW